MNIPNLYMTCYFIVIFDYLTASLRSIYNRSQVLPQYSLDDNFESLTKGYRFAVDETKVKLMGHVRRGLQQTIELSLNHLILLFRNLHTHS